MDKKKLAEMIKQIRKTNMEQVGGMGKFKGGAVDLQDLSSPNRPVGKSSKEQHHMTEVIGPTHHKALSQIKRIGVRSKLPSKRRRFQAYGNQRRTPETYTESEKDIGNTMTDKKGKRRETINLEPKQSDEKIF